MKSHEDDEIYENLDDNQPKRTKRNKFSELEDKDGTNCETGQAFQ